MSRTDSSTNLKDHASKNPKETTMLCFLVVRRDPSVRQISWESLCHKKMFPKAKHLLWSAVQNKDTLNSLKKTQLLILYYGQRSHFYLMVSPRVSKNEQPRLTEESLHLIGESTRSVSSSNVISTMIRTSLAGHQYSITTTERIRGEKGPTSLQHDWIMGDSS